MNFYSKDDLRDSVHIDDKLDGIPEEERVEQTIANIRKRNISVKGFSDPKAACAYLFDRLPADGSVMTGHSTTLNEIGIIEQLESSSDVDYLAPKIRAIDDPDERRDARRRAVAADLFVDGVNAITESGQLVGVNGKGTSLGAWPYPADRLLLVAGINKIVPTLDDAMERIQKVAYPLEDARVRAVENHGSVVGKVLIYEEERQDDRTELVLLKGTYGY